MFNQAKYLYDAGWFVIVQESAFSSFGVLPSSESR